MYSTINTEKILKARSETEKICIILGSVKMMFISIVLFKPFIVENTKILQMQHKTIEIRRKM